jgi:hypothetical protein
MGFAMPLMRFEKFLPENLEEIAGTGGLKQTDFSQTSNFGEFFEKLDVRESFFINRLFESLLAIETKNCFAHQLDNLLIDIGKAELDPMQVLVLRSFCLAIKSRFEKNTAGGGNLYLGARPPGMQLRAFELLRLRTPLISFAYAAANRAILDVIESPCDVTLIDVGVGIARQTRALLKNPASKHLLKSLKVIGVEPDSADALIVAEQTIQEAAMEAGIESSFVGISKTGEDLSVRDIQAARPRGLVLGNSAFCMHHLPSDSTHPNRDSLLRVLRQAGVNALVMVEPDSNHDVDNPLARFLFAYRHYRSVSHCLSSSLTAANAALVWREFYGPEVQNVVTHDGAYRTERHEENATWARRLRQAGWEVDKLRDVVARSAAPLGFDVGSIGNAFSLFYRGVSLLSVLRARSE